MVLTGVLLLGVEASCNYPDFVFVSATAGGTGATSGDAGSGGTAGAVGGSAGAVVGGGTAGSDDGQSGAASQGSGGESGGQPASLCGVRPAPAPDECFNGLPDGNESDIDCGGDDCQACFDTTPFRVEYQCGDPNRSSLSPRFQLKLWNEGDDPVALATLSVRYYFRRNGVTEPIHIRSGQTILFQDVVPLYISDDTTWSIVKINADEDDDYDVTIDIRFSGAYTLLPGDRVELYQELFAGNDGVAFDQATHYSFESSAVPYQDNARITVFDGEQLVWGYEPRRGGDRSCFVRAINLGGDAVTLDDDDWEGDMAGALETTGVAFDGPPANVRPAVQGALAEVLASGYELAANQSVSVPTESGDYLAYVYAVSGAGEELGTFAIEDSAELGAFKAGAIEGTPGWAKLGPYPVRVDDGVFDFSCLSGVVRIAGIELRTPSTASH
ncbi:MAG TPA: cellulose binding domain-containing protein [Polyangiaceae bacterium]|nr:cellulose binding domain-containing protein [Polyangiaceae bacterium]